MGEADHEDDFSASQGLARTGALGQVRAMRIYFCAVVLLWLGGGGVAAAQTMLDLSATGTALATPDEMVASLSAEATGPGAAQAQARLNQMMRTALAAARAVNGVGATTADYSVQQTDDDNTGKPAGFQASQTLNLTMAAPGGVPPAAFTRLTGELQQAGLLLNGFDGALSATGADAANQAATADAIRRLRAAAAAVAASLGDTVGAMKTINVGANTPGPIMPQGMMMMAKAATPPQAAPGPVTVQASVEATIELRPGA